MATGRDRKTGHNPVCLYISIYLNWKHHEEGGAVAALSDQPLLRVVNLVYKTWRYNYYLFRFSACFKMVSKEIQINRIVNMRMQRYYRERSRILNY